MARIESVQERVRSAFEVYAHMRRTEHEPMDVVRVFPVAPVPFEHVERELDAGTPIADIDLVNVLFGRKSAASKPSANLVTEFGGTVLEEESPWSAAARVFAERVNVPAIHSTETMAAWKEEVANNESPCFEYSIKGYERPRRVRLFVLPVMSQSYYTHELRDASEDKMGELLSFSKQDAIRLIREGSVTQESKRYDMIGHLTEAPSEIAIDAKEQACKDCALEHVISRIGQYEEQIRDRMLREANRARSVKGAGQAVTLDELSRFEALAAYKAAQLTLNLETQTVEEKNGDTRTYPKESDLLFAGRYLSQASEDEFLQHLASLPTKETKQALFTIKRSFLSALEELSRQLGDPPSAVGRISYADFPELWSRVMRLPVEDQAKAMRMANKKMLTDIARIYGVSVTTASRAARETTRFMPRINDDIRMSDVGPNVFQSHREQFEVELADLVGLTAIALYRHPSLDETLSRSGSQYPIMRFEAMRKLAVFLVNLDTMRSRRDLNNELLLSLMSGYFGLPDATRTIDLKDGIIHRVSHYKLPDGTRVMVEQRGAKQTQSLVRKKFTDSGAITDDFSVNIVLVDDDYGSGTEGIRNRIQKAKEVQAGFNAYVKENLKKMLKNDIALETDGIQRVLTLIEESPDHRKAMIRRLSGKRAGSLGDRIIRMKSKVEVDTGMRNHVIEVCVYPFADITQPESKMLDELGLWGFKQKLEDDASGRYVTMRLISRDHRRILDMSFYDMLFPNVHYEQAAWQFEGSAVERAKTPPESLKRFLIDRKDAIVRRIDTFMVKHFR